MSYDNSDDLAYNPFAEEDDHPSESSSTQGYYSSAFFPKLSPSRPTLRRRRSLTDRSLKDGQRPKRHTRTPTEIQITPPYSAGLHPLKSALAATNNGSILQDLGVTRPYLSRMVNEGTLVDAPMLQEATVTDKIPSSPDQEKDVIVHQISSKDSLAGVSLKYGISLPNLRRANQLWTSDSIHLRDVLYIPIDQASRAREYIPEPKLISFTPDLQDSTTNPFDHTSFTNSPVKSELSNSFPPSPSVPIRRIPTKQLSYFPPSTSKHSELKSDGPADATNAHLHSPGGSKLSPGPNKYSSTSVNNSLNSILTALPIAASTRDEIITRLSFDSVSSSFSERSRVNSDEEIGHELDEVPRRRDPHGTRDSPVDDMDELSMPTPKASQRPPHRLPARTQPTSTLPSSLPKTSHVHPYSSASPPRFYVSQAHETFIRTSQLEPSPAMQLPNFRSSTVGRSAGRSLSNGNREEHASRPTLNGKKRDLGEESESSLDLGKMGNGRLK